MKANCPSCGFEVAFKSSVSVFSVCGHCKSMIVRRDMDLESLGKMAQLPDDVSPFKIGSRGKYKNTVFEIIGRLKIAWSEGFWNEWYLFFEDGRYGWLAEAMGFFMVSFEVKDTGNVPKFDDLRVGKGHDLVPMKTFFVDDIKETVCEGSEGELPFKGFVGRQTISVDLSDHSGEFACIEYSEQDGVRLYVGTYVAFDELDFSELRDLSTDIKKIRSAKVFKCPSCGGPFSLRTPGLTASVACRYCGSTLDATDKTFAILSKAKEKMKITPLIPLGAKGKLNGVEWEITGFMRRSDEAALYPWDEYLLFNPYYGFRWLTTYNGHWNLVEMMRIHPWGASAGTDIKYGGKTYKKFTGGKARVNYVIGEFYWRVKLGDTVDMGDYICPPEILSKESDKSEEVWSLGRYIEADEIKKAFGIEDNMPKMIGVAPNQPSPYPPPVPKRVWLSFAALAALLTLLQFYFASTSPAREVYRGNFIFDNKLQTKTIVTPSFDIPEGSGNLLVKLHSPVQNDWLEASVDLVDERTNKSLGFGQGVEYYSGSDSDGSWSEGDQNNELILSAVPGGRYHLIIEPASDILRKGEKSFTLSLRRGVATWSNYFGALMLMIVYPFYVWIRSSSFESRRWAESDMQPPTAGSGGDDE
ncbi:MAG: DUF4178 domain-containing protein [Nitrospirae bacterium]|nr:MAG: DUF4178 domain-containing protein [Nitrospirota bacterium]